jgi:hypothetical protein
LAAAVTPRADGVATVMAAALFAGAARKKSAAVAKAASRVLRILSLPASSHCREQTCMHVNALAAILLFRSRWIQVSACRSGGKMFRHK